MMELVPYIMSGGMAVLSGLAGLAVRILWKLAANVAELNTKMAVIVAELANYAKRSDRVDEMIEELDVRLRRVERYLVQ